MLHFECPHDRDSFASLVHVLQSVGAFAAVGSLRAQGVRSARQLEQASKTDLRKWVGDDVVDALFCPRFARGNRNRPDVPVVHPYARGSQALVSGAASSAASLAQADAEFAQDKFAASSRGPRESRWRVWCSMAGQRGLPTTELVDKVGALFKAARYRSAAQYYSVAKGYHKQAGYAVSQALRSINRGIGPSSAKLDIPLERMGRAFSCEMEAAFVALRVPQDQRLWFPGDAVIVASWFLLRGVEMANLRCEHVSFTRAGEVKLYLPISKTDPTARGCHRSHMCICSRQHSPTCPVQSDTHLLFTPAQQCSCDSGRHPLCAYHAALRVSISLRRQGAWSPTTVFLGRGTDEMPSKQQVVFLARAAAWVLCKADMHEWPPLRSCVVGPSTRFVWQARRCSLGPAWMFLLGRWGSAAVFRYIQEAALAEPGRAADAVQSRTSLQGPVQGGTGGGRPGPLALGQIRAVAAECLRGQGVLVHNVRSKFAHKLCVGEGAAPSEQWVSSCGRWRYGQASCLRNPTLRPGFKLCPLCFPEEQSLAAAQAPSPAVPAVQEPEGSSSSSSED